MSWLPWRRYIEGQVDDLNEETDFLRCENAAFRERFKKLEDRVKKLEDRVKVYEERTKANVKFMEQQNEFTHGLVAQMKDAKKDIETLYTQIGLASSNLSGKQPSRRDGRYS